MRSTGQSFPPRNGGSVRTYRRRWAKLPIFQQGRNGLEGWFEFCFIVDFPQNFALSFDRIYAKQVFLFLPETQLTQDMKRVIRNRDGKVRKGPFLQNEPSLSISPKLQRNNFRFLDDAAASRADSKEENKVFYLSFCCGGRNGENRVLIEKGYR